MYREADIILLMEGNTGAPQLDLAPRPGGVDEQGAYTKVPQEPGRS